MNIFRDNSLCFDLKIGTHTEHELTYGVINSCSLVKFSVSSTVDMTGQNGCHRECSSWAPPQSTVGSGDKYVLQTNTLIIKGN